MHGPFLNSSSKHVRKQFTCPASPIKTVENLSLTKDLKNNQVKNCTVIFKHTCRNYCRIVGWKTRTTGTQERGTITKSLQMNLNQIERLFKLNIINWFTTKTPPPKVF